MNQSRPASILARVTGVLFVAVAASAVFLHAEAPRASGAWSVSEDSRLWLEGDSTLHPYSATATVVRVTAAVSGMDGSLLDRFRTNDLQSLTVAVPVEGLRSEKRALTNNMHERLEAEQHPEITFDLKRYEAAPGRAPGEAVVKAEGALTVAGETRPISIEALASSPAPNALRFSGKKRLLMSDFGIKPPTMFLGTLKTRDEVEIHFDITLVPTTQTKTKGDTP